MKLAALIKKLEKLKDKHGDVDVMVDVDGFDCQVESVKFNELDDSRVIIYLGQTEGIDY